MCDDTSNNSFSLRVFDSDSVVVGFTETQLVYARMNADEAAARDSPGSGRASGGLPCWGDEGRAREAWKRLSCQVL